MCVLFQIGDVTNLSQEMENHSPPAFTSTKGFLSLLKSSQNTGLPSMKNMLFNIKFKDKDIQILGLRTEADRSNGCYVGQVKPRLVGFRAHEKPQLSGRSALSFAQFEKSCRVSQPSLEESRPREVKQFKIVEK